MRLLMTQRQKRFTRLLVCFLMSGCCICLRSSLKATGRRTTFSFLDNGANLICALRSDIIAVCSLCIPPFSESRNEYHCFIILYIHFCVFLESSLLLSNSFSFCFGNSDKLCLFFAALRLMCTVFTTHSCQLLILSLCVCCSLCLSGFMSTINRHGAGLLQAPPNGISTRSDRALLFYHFHAFHFCFD